MTQRPLASVPDSIVNLVPFLILTPVLRHRVQNLFNLHLSHHSKNPTIVQSRLHHRHPHLKMKMISKKMRLRNITSTDKSTDVLL